MQTTSSILMIKPVKFGFNIQTADSNSFQNKQAIEDALETQRKALAEFNQIVEKLKENYIQVIVIDDTEMPHTPDSIFPNNWVSFHDEGSIVLYPMQADNRRLERREDILHTMKKDFTVRNVLDLSHYEQKNKFLEGTGSMVLDRVHKIAYACLSPRTHADVLEDFCNLMKYRAVTFKAVDRAGKEIYHTNVVMCVGEHFVVICLEAIPDVKERENLLENFKTTHKTVVEITLSQLENFAGNMLEVKNQQGENILVMSERAYKALTNEQTDKITRFAKILHAPLTTIENNGGGSARCMMAEVFLPSLLY